jgi:hypothetical protein
MDWLGLGRDTGALSFIAVYQVDECLGGWAMVKGRASSRGLSDLVFLPLTLQHIRESTAETCKS